MGDLNSIVEGWGNITKILDSLLHPFTTGSEMSAVLGGAQFLYSVFALSAILYTYWHTKNSYPAGIVGVVVGGAGLVFPELRTISWLFVALGGALIMFRFVREFFG